MRYVFKENPAMFVQFVVNAMGIQESYKDPSGIINAGIDKLEAFFKSLNLPTSLHEIGIGDEKFEMIAKPAVNYNKNPHGTRGRFKEMKWMDILVIYKMAL